MKTDTVDRKPMAESTTEPLKTSRRNKPPPEPKICTIEPRGAPDPGALIDPF